MMALPANKTGTVPDRLVPLRGECGAPCAEQTMSETMVVYCLKCKARREARVTERATLKTGARVARGVCLNCGTRVYRLVAGKE